MRNRLALLWMLLCAVAPASAQVSVGIGLPSLSIGINLPSYPQLTPVPGYPVYYAPGLMSNYFFYDGMYWVYQADSWYASSWYNGPWGLVAPEVVPVFVLRVPVSYYRQPPAYFRGWRADAPPHWGEHWGHDWEQRRGGWDRWNHASVPARAPLPTYQLQYREDRYPRVKQQRALQNENYRYKPRDAVVREHYRTQAVQIAPASTRRVTQAPAPERDRGPPGPERSNPSPPRQDQPSRHVEAPRQQAPSPRGPETGVQGRAERETKHAPGNGRENDRDKSDDRGRDHK